MSNRTHMTMIKRIPWIGVRGYFGDGPQPWLKRMWHKIHRQQVRVLLRKDPENAVFPRRIGEREDWY